MNTLLYMINDYTFQTVALGSAVLGLISGILGSFAVLRKQSLLGDGVSHAALPGVVLVFILTGTKDTKLLLLGALLSGLLATWFIITIVKHTRIKFDSALALIMSVFFGLGLVLLTYVQKIPNSNQAGLKRFIFGQASTLLKEDVNFMILCGLILLFLVLLFWKEIKIFIFDQEYAKTLGFPIQLINLLLSFMIVVAIIIGLQTVGVILMSAMLVAPQVASRQWTNKLWKMVLLSALFGAFSGVAGTATSSVVAKLPTGPMIVIYMSLLVIISLLFAPKRGILQKVIHRKALKRSLQTKGGDSNASTN